MKEESKGHKKKEHKKEKRKHHKKKDHNSGTLVSRDEAVAMLEKTLDGIRTGAITVNCGEDKTETTISVPELVKVKIKSKSDQEESKLSIKLSWPQQANDQ